MAGNGPKDGQEFTTLISRDRQQQEAKEVRELRQRKEAKLREELEARLEIQGKIMGKYRSPDEGKLGGLVGKFMHLADLNAEQLAGQVIGQMLFDILGLIANREYRIDARIFEDAAAQGIAYTGAEDQTIYRTDLEGNLDFSSPYLEGESIPMADIYRNGYIPPADQWAALSKHMNQSVQDYMGANAIRDDGLVMMFGAKAAKEIRQKHGRKSTEKDLVSDDAARRAQMMKPSGGSGS